MRHISDLEKRLEQAADEVRQNAKHSARPSIDARRRSRPRGWLVFAAAFGAVIIVIGVLPLISRSDEQNPSGAPSPTTAVQERDTTVAAESTTTTITGAGTGEDICSATGLAEIHDQEGLPEPVADTRRAIVDSAITCYVDALGRLAGVGPNGREGPDLITSFGGGGFENIVEWESDGEEPLALLVRLLDLPYATQDIQGTRYYVWPSAFVYDTWEEIPPEDLDSLLTIYTREELDQIATFGSYAGWRIGITEHGEWRFFVAGD